MTHDIVNMYDSVNVEALPEHGNKYAGYVNGEFENHDAIAARFPGARVFGIDVFGTDWKAAAIIDFEHGDVQDKTTLRKFITNRNKFRDQTAIVYCNRDSLASVEEFADGLDFRIWLATLDGTDMTGQLSPGGRLIVATQITGGPTSPFDVSTTLVSWT